MACRYGREEVALHNTASDAWVVVDGRVYDVTKFLDSHPGGLSVTEEYLGSDISAVLRSEDPHRHSATAFEVLEQYCIGSLEGWKASPTDSLQSKQWKEDDLVDWSKAMLGQVGAVGAHYKEWVHSPVNRKLRLFQSDVLEAMTKSPWWLVPLVWIPFAAYVSWNALAGAPSFFPSIPSSEPMSPALFVALLPLGVLLWTLIEYSLHRFVFHLDPPPTSPYWIMFHFVIHGQHHKVPFDRFRLVFPPVPAGLIMLVLYLPPAHFIPLCITRALFVGGLLGYIAYDLTHYYVHHGSPQPGSYFGSMKTYHIAHHYINFNRGFGITTKLWDFPFQTVLQMTNAEASEVKALEKSQ